MVGSGRVDMGLGFGWWVVERERQLVEHGRERERERERCLVILFYGVVYTLYYYFNALYLKIKNEILGILLNDILK